MRGDVAEEAQDPRFVAPFLLQVREVEGALGDRHRIVPAAGRELCLAEIGYPAGARPPTPRRGSRPDGRDQCSSPARPAPSGHRWHRGVFPKDRSESRGGMRPRQDMSLKRPIHIVEICQIGSDRLVGMIQNREVD